MAEYTVKQLVDAGRAAEAAGDVAAANRFRQAAQNMQQQTPEQPQQDLSAIDTFADSGRGITTGAVAAARKGEEWLWRGVKALGRT